MSIYCFDSDEKAAYASILLTINNLKKEAVVPLLSVDTLLSIFRKALCESENGYLYDQTKIVVSDSFSQSYIKFDFLEDIRERIKLDTQIMYEFYEIVKRANREKSIREQIRYVYSYFVKHFQYAYDECNDKRFHSVINLFKYRKSVCDGFSLCFALILNELNIPCGIITGYSNFRDSNGPHAWNIVQIGSHYYHLDVTWDICLKSESHDLFDYFLLDDSLVKRDHLWNDSTIPKAIDLSLEDYSHKNLSFRTKRDCVNLIISEIKQKKPVISFRYLGSDIHISLNMEQIKHIFNKAVQEANIAYSSVSYSVNSTSGIARFDIVY